MEAYNGTAHWSGEVIQTEKQPQEITESYQDYGRTELMASNPANEKDERGKRETTGVQVRLMDLHGSGCMRLANPIMAQERAEKKQG